MIEPRADELKLEVQYLKDLLSEAREVILWMSGSGDFSSGGPAEEGWSKIVRPMLQKLQEATR